MLEELGKWSVDAKVFLDVFGFGLDHGMLACPLSQVCNLSVCSKMHDWHISFFADSGYLLHLEVIEISCDDESEGKDSIFVDIVNCSIMRDSIYIWVELKQVL